MHSAANRGTAHKFVENDRYHSSLLRKETRDDACFAAGMMWETRRVAQPPFCRGSSETNLQEV
jgi:hypothetical protein